VSAYLGVGKVDGRSATDVRGVLTPLKDMAEELHIAVLGISHFNKKDDIKSALLRVSDSIAYVAAARHVYAVIDDPEDKNLKLFVKAKNNLARDAKALRYGIGVKKVGHDKGLGVDIEAPFIVWHPKHVEITANEAMAAGGQSANAKREAGDFLLDRLEAGAVRADDILEEAKQNGIARNTLYRAKKDLGIKSDKEQGKTEGNWVWKLPPKGKMPNPLRSSPRGGILGILGTFENTQHNNPDIMEDAQHAQHSHATPPGSPHRGAASPAENSEKPHLSLAKAGRCAHCGKPGAEPWDLNGRVIHLHAGCQHAWEEAHDALEMESVRRRERNCSPTEGSREASKSCA
jgi:hypothetical protein